jgi:N-acetyl sugar amidotransferase
MDTTDPRIKFDLNGVCNNCTSFLLKREEVKQRKKLGPENLERVIATIKKEGRHGKYDALLGISGGVDSCYAAHLLKSLGVRTLLVHMDNGWNSEAAYQNIKSVIKISGFDYESYVLDWEEFKDIQLAFLKASVIEAETPTDVAIQGALHQVAAKHGTKFIISGGNLATEGILPDMWHYNARDTTYFNHIQKAFGKRKISKFPQFGYQEEMFYKLVKRIRIIYLLNYVDYDKGTALKVLQEQYNWKSYGGKHHESRFTKFIQSYLLPTKFNVDYRKATLSSLICAGKIHRQEALEILQTPPYKEEEIEPEKVYISKKLGISKEELNRIIAAPRRFYFEYPNNERKLKFIYQIYQKLFYILFFLTSGNL